MRRHARRWPKEYGQSVSVDCAPLRFAAGESYLFDWNLESVVQNGATVTAKFAYPVLIQNQLALCQ